MSDAHTHHQHSHHHGPASYDRAFAIGVALNLAFVAVEAAFGFWADSLALLADAGHNLSDVLGLFLAWGAAVLSRRRPTGTRTYGWRKSSVFAALINALALLMVVGAMAWEAIRRFMAPAPSEGWTMILVAAIGVVINTATALLFLRGRKGDLNIRGAFLHMAADAAVSLGVVLTGAGILLSGWLWLDPAITLIIVAVIIIGTWGLLLDSLNLALDAVPSGINSTAVRLYLLGLPGVTEVHDLHIWGMSTTETALTAHLVKPEPDGDDELVRQVQHELHDRFHIEHVTIQWERGACEGESCDLPSPERV